MTLQLNVVKMTPHSYCDGRSGSGGTPRRFGMGVILGESLRPSKTQGLPHDWKIERITIE